MRKRVPNLNKLQLVSFLILKNKLKLTQFDVKYSVVAMQCNTKSDGVQSVVQPIEVEYIATLEEIKNLKLQLPLITIDVISEEHLHIASSAKEVNVQGYFWEINAEEQDLFPEAD